MSRWGSRVAGIAATALVAGGLPFIQGSAQSAEPPVVPRAKPALSVKAPLPKSAYRGLACDPFSKRLRKTALPNGVGPEARAAAACMRLEWRSRAKAKVPPITVHFSKGFPQQYVDRLEKATAAGHRLFGRFGNVTSYEILASTDAAYSCRQGKKLFDPRADIKPWFGKWENGYNTGCPGSSYSPAGWTSGILGEEGTEYFAWTLIKPEASYYLSDTSVLGPTWFFGAVSHEFAHSIQMQRSLGSTNGEESIGRWFDEGQAQYLGNIAAAYTIGPADIRSAQMQQLREVMREEGVTRIDFATMENDWQTNLVFPAGYFAYEWLLAHYGLEATFEWRTQWNTDCERPGSSVCWRERAQEMFGMSDVKLIKTLNRYVNRQLKGR